MQLYILRFFYWLATHLSLANVERIATLLGDLTWLFHSRVRRDLEANLHQVMPHATERQLARASRQALRTLCRIYADELRTPSIPKSEFLAALDVHGREHLDQSLQDGKGAILTTAHFGAPQIVAQILALWDYPTMTVVEHTQPEAIFQFMKCATWA